MLMAPDYGHLPPPYDAPGDPNPVDYMLGLGSENPGGHLATQQPMMAPASENPGGHLATQQPMMAPASANTSDPILKPSALANFFADPDGFTAYQHLNETRPLNHAHVHHQDLNGLHLDGAYDSINDEPDRWPLPSNTISNPAATLAATSQHDYDLINLFPEYQSANDEVLTTAGILTGFSSSQDMPQSTMHLSDCGPGGFGNLGMTGGLEASNWGVLAPSNPIIPGSNNFQSPLNSSSGPSGPGSFSSTPYTPTTQTSLSGSNIPEFQAQLTLLQRQQEQVQFQELQQQRLQQMQQTWEPPNMQHMPRSHSVQLRNARNGGLINDTAGYESFPMTGVHTQNFNNMRHTALPTANHQLQRRPPPFPGFGNDPQFMSNGFRPENNITDANITEHLMSYPESLGIRGTSNYMNGNGGEMQSFRPGSQPQHMPPMQRHYSDASPMQRQYSDTSPYGPPMASPMARVMQRQYRDFERPTQMSRRRGTECDEEEDEEPARCPRKLRRQRRAKQEDDEEWRPDYDAGHVPRRGPKFPKAENFSDNDEDQITVRRANPSDKALGKRRTSNVSKTPPTPMNSKNTSKRVSLTSFNSSDVEDSNAPSSDFMTVDSSSKRPKNTAGRAGSNRKNLTEEEKRANHIASEQKRRDEMKQNYTHIENMVPALKCGKSGHSKSEVLGETVKDYGGLKHGNKFFREWLEEQEAKEAASNLQPGHVSEPGAEHDDSNDYDLGDYV